MCEDILKRDNKQVYSRNSTHCLKDPLIKTNKQPTQIKKRERQKNGYKALTIKAANLYLYSQRPVRSHIQMKVYSATTLNVEPKRIL